jgi:hypothetical protein
VSEWKVRTALSAGTSEKPGWAVVSGERPVRFAIITMNTCSDLLRNMISDREWQVFREDNVSISMQTIWCRKLPTAGTILLCAHEIPGSTM